MTRKVKAVITLMTAAALATTGIPANAATPPAPQYASKVGNVVAYPSLAQQIPLASVGTLSAVNSAVALRMKKGRTSRIKTAKPVPTASGIRARAVHAAALKSNAASGIQLAGALILPFNDGIGDSVTVTYRSGILNDLYNSSPGDYSIAIADSTNAVVRNFGVITAQSVLVDPNCDYYNFACDYQDVLSFVWDGKNDSAADVTAANYNVTVNSGAVATVSVHDFALTGVTGPAATTYLAPLPDGVLDNVVVNVTAHTYGDIPVTSTGQADLKDGSGTVLQSFPLTDLVQTHMISIIAPPLGVYSLVVSLTSQGQTTSAAFPVSSVQTALTAASVKANFATVFPFIDGVRDSVKISMSSTTSVKVPVPVTGSVTVKSGSSTVTTIPVSTSTQVVSWNGRVNGKVVPGVYSISARIKAAEGNWQQAPVQSVTVMQTVTGAPSVTMPYTTVYPSHDGYRDTLPITASAKLNTGATGAGSVVVVVKSGSSSIQKWTYNRTGAHVSNWNGKRGSAISPGKYSIIVTAKGPEGASKTVTKSVIVSPKKLVAHSAVVKQVYLASTARDDCGGGGYRTCTDGQTRSISGTTFTDVTEYYTGYISGDIMWSAQSLPLPSGTTSYRIIAVADTYDARYVSGYCYSDSSNPDDCPSGAGGAFPLYSAGAFTFPWTSVGASDGSADFFIGSTDWGFLYVAGFQVEAKRTWKTLQ